MAYLLDANVFIEAKNRHYGFDFCPGFWEWLLEANADGKVFSVESVADELQGVADELSNWAADRDAGFFLAPQRASAVCVGEEGIGTSRQAHRVTKVACN